MRLRTVLLLRDIFEMCLRMRVPLIMMGSPVVGNRPHPTGLS